MHGKTYDIVLLPNEAIAKRAIQLSEELSQTYQTRFTLSKTVVPHYSIYMAQLIDEEVAEAASRLKTIADSFSQFSLEATRYWQDMAEGFFEVQYQRTPQLIALQEHVIEQFNPLRKEQFLAEYPPGYTKEEQQAKLTGNALAQFLQFAYPEIGEDYRPHMTFTRLQRSAYETKIKNNLPDIASFSGDFPSLGLFVMGHNGTCIKQVAVLQLQDKH